MTLSVIVKNSANMTRYFITILLFFIGFNGFSQVDTTKVDTLTWGELKVEQEWIFDSNIGEWIAVPKFTEEQKKLDSSIVTMIGVLEYEYGDTSMMVLTSGIVKLSGFGCRKYGRSSNIKMLSSIENDSIIESGQVTLEGRLLVSNDYKGYFVYSMDNVIIQKYTPHVYKKKQKKK